MGSLGPWRSACLSTGLSGASLPAIYCSSRIRSAAPRAARTSSPEEGLTSESRCAGPWRLWNGRGCGVKAARTRKAVKVMKEARGAPALSRRHPLLGPLLASGWASPPASFAPWKRRGVQNASKRRAPAIRGSGMGLRGWSISYPRPRALCATPVEFRSLPLRLRPLWRRRPRASALVLAPTAAPPAREPASAAPDAAFWLRITIAQSAASWPLLALPMAEKTLRPRALLLTRPLRPPFLPLLKGCRRMPPGRQSRWLTP